MVSRFFICFEARCGSGFLLNRLNHQPNVYAENEWMMFRKRDDPDRNAQAAHVRPFYDAMDARGDLAAAGFISKVSDLADKKGFIRSLRAASARIIDLRRRNICKQALSNIRAVEAREKSGHAHAYEKAHVQSASTIDPAQFWNAVRGFEKRLAVQDNFVRSADLPTIQIYYEDMVADSASYRALLAFLGIVRVVRVDAPEVTLKQTADRFRDAVTNFVAIQRLAPSAYYADLLTR